jgi:predicted nucleic acid-binding protein
VGTQRIEKGIRGEIVLDAGGLIAFERAAEGIAAVIQQAARIGATLVIPASVLAQAWRGGPRAARLAQLVANSVSDPLDEPRARQIGERLATREATDIADAHVVCCALDRGAVLVTSDKTDMEALAGPGEHLTLVSI